MVIAVSLSGIIAKCFTFSDAGVIHSIQTGVGLSRSKVVYFRHNDMADLRRILEQTRKDDVDQKKKPYRTFVVIEGLYQNYGGILVTFLSPFLSLYLLRNTLKILLRSRRLLLLRTNISSES